jgi:hypothetical protein
VWRESKSVPGILAVVALDFRVLAEVVVMDRMV